MKISELAELSGGEIARMSNEELTSIIRTAGWNLNKRAKRLESENLSTFSPSYRSFSAATGGKGRVIAYGKNQSELRHQVIAARNFARAKTSTMAGAKKEKIALLRLLNNRKKRQKPADRNSPERTQKKVWVNGGTTLRDSMRASPNMILGSSSGRIGQAEEKGRPFRRL